MDINKETFETWNKVASLYQEKFMDLDLYNETYDIFCNSIPKINPSILDIGCGPGNITKYLLSKRPDFNILGIDFAPNMIELAKLNNPKANFAVKDSRNIAELETIYDGIVCGFCIPYLSSVECETLISDAYNLLNEAGLLYISFVEGDSINSGFKVSSTGDRTYFYYHELDKLQKQLEKNLFEEPKVYKVKFIKSDSEQELHTILIAKKKSDLLY